jgi:DNA-binding transcriptional LysR family regulator
MNMMPMRLEKLRQADLNLLITFAAIAEEKSITAAASRLFLSQPAVSRALQRARAMFQDDLLVRSPNGFELTLRGRKILDELEGLLPRIENLVAPALFDPTQEKSNFRISGRITFVQSCFRLCAGSTQTDAIKSTLNSGPGGAASQNSWNTGSLI